MSRKIAGTGLVFVLVSLLPFVSTKVTLDPGLIPRFLFLGIVVMGMSIVFLLNVFKNNKLRKLNSPIIVIYGLFIIYSIFRVSGTYFIGDSLFEWTKLALYFILTLLLYQSLSFKTIRNSLPFSISFLGFVLTFWGLFELYGIVESGNFEIPNSTYSITTCFEHRNLFVQVLLLTLPFQFYQIYTAKKKGYAYLILIVACLTIFLLIILSSRAVWLAGLVSIGLFVLLIIFEKLRKGGGKIPLYRLFQTMIAVLLAGIFSYIFIANVSKQADFKNHSSEIITGNTGTVSDRFELWDRTLDLFYEKPIIGHGLANWKIELLKYDHEGLTSEDNVTFYQRPHNDYLWIVSETGIIGLVLYLSIVVLLLIGIFRSIVNSSDFKTRLFFIALAVSFSAYLVYSFFSFPGERVYQNVLIQFFIVSCLVYHDEENPVPVSQTERKLFIPLGLLFVIIAILALVVGSYRFKGEYYLKNVLQAKSAKSYQKIIDEVENANSLFYQLSPTSTPLRWYSGFGLFKLQRIEEANNHFLEAVKINPYHIHVLNNLGSTYFILGEPEEALKYYERAVKIAPNFDESWFNLCAVYYNQEDYSKAYSSLIKVNLYTTDKRYKSFIKSVVTHLIEEEAEKMETPTSVNLPQDENWYFEIFKLMRNEHRELKNIIFDPETIPKQQP